MDGMFHVVFVSVYLSISKFRKSYRLDLHEHFTKDVSSDKENAVGF